MKDCGLLIRFLSLMLSVFFFPPLSAALITQVLLLRERMRCHECRPSGHRAGDEMGTDGTNAAEMM